MAERNIRITVEYEGTAYCGWQIQTGQETIQGRLVEAIKSITGLEVNLIGAGRTDAGVHALGQVANFRIEHPLEADRFAEAINYYLPDDIRVKSSGEVELDFHARKSALWRRYRYLIGSEKSAVHRHFRWAQPYDLNLPDLQKAAALIIGDHDFGPFCVVRSRKENNRCQVQAAKWLRVGPLLLFEIRANRFLHGMVRSLVGGMLNLAAVNPDNNKLNLTLDKFANIIESRTDERVTFTAPAHGLYFVSVGYKEGTRK